MTLRKQHDRAEKALDHARDRVYAVAHPRRDVAFSECLRMAPPAARERYAAARARVDETEQEAIARGKAWRSSIGLLVWNRA